MNGPNCSNCRHFFITWNPQTPNGCRRFGIQCRERPSQIVFMAGQGECQGFEEKIKPNKNQGKLDLNRKDIW